VSHDIPADTLSDLLVPVADLECMLEQILHGDGVGNLETPRCGIQFKFLKILRLKNRLLHLEPNHGVHALNPLPIFLLKPQFVFCQLLILNGIRVDGLHPHLVIHRADMLVYFRIYFRGYAHGFVRNVYPCLASVVRTVRVTDIPALSVGGGRSTLLLYPPSAENPVLVLRSWLLPVKIRPCDIDAPVVVQRHPRLTVKAHVVDFLRPRHEIFPALLRFRYGGYGIVEGTVTKVFRVFPLKLLELCYFNRLRHISYNLTHQG